MRIRLQTVSCWYNSYSLSNTAKSFLDDLMPDLVLTTAPDAQCSWTSGSTPSEMDGTVYGANGESSVLTCPSRYVANHGILVEFHMVQSEPLLRKMGIEYDPAGKYKTRMGDITRQTHNA